MKAMAMAMAMAIDDDDVRQQELSAVMPSALLLHHRSSAQGQLPATSSLSIGGESSVLQTAMWIETAMLHVDVTWCVLEVGR
jgi:hypothetical protein